jgi:hypothetical protein
MAIVVLTKPHNHLTLPSEKPSQKDRDIVAEAMAAYGPIRVTGQRLKDGLWTSSK